MEAFEATLLELLQHLLVKRIGLARALFSNIGLLGTAFLLNSNRGLGGWKGWAFKAKIEGLGIYISKAITLEKAKEANKDITFSKFKNHKRDNKIECILMCIVCLLASAACIEEEEKK